MKQNLEIITDSEKFRYPALVDVSHLPFSIRILVENLLRNGHEEMAERIKLKWGDNELHNQEIPFYPSRVLMQDFTGVPAVVDLAALRETVKSFGIDPSAINPKVPVDLVIDHSVQVDSYGSPEALAQNTEREFERNSERYEFLRWGQNVFKNFRVIPPATGIVHQVNLEYLATTVTTKDGQIFPDTLVGTDSHTTMINGLGVLGWGVGGIEAEAAMLGQPISILIPRVVGVRLVGELKNGVTATDLVLTITQRLRSHGVVEKFVEFFGSAVATLSLPDRATISNMAPEYGATIGFFPPDAETIRYLINTGRDIEQVHLAERYLRAQGLFVFPPFPRVEQGGLPQNDIKYSETIEIDLSEIETSVAGPTRPQDRVALKDIKNTFQKFLGDEANSSKDNGNIHDGSVLIAAITSCTNTSNPSVMLAAGLLARNAVKNGLRTPSHVKTSLAPGSQVVKAYLESSGLIKSLETLGFHIVGFGCTTCIGNSGPIDDSLTKIVEENKLVTASVLSGNRNFEGRIHSITRANFLASPPLVVAFALAGRVDIDFENEPIGHDPDGLPIFLRNIWPSNQEIQSIVHNVLKPELFKTQYQNVTVGSDQWKSLSVPNDNLYKWNEKSTYIRLPTFFAGLTKKPDAIKPIYEARALLVLGDSVTTDHISPAGNIARTGPTADYLRENGIEPKDFNSYGARRGNHEVMMRGTFANVRLKNELAPGTEGGVTIHIPTDELTSVFEAAERYKKEKTPLVVIAGKDYGMGSSRDWAAKGPALLGVRAVLFESVERIHRSNLIGMGILPLQFLEGQNRKIIGLTGRGKFTIPIDNDLKPGQKITVTALNSDGSNKTFEVLCRLDSVVECEYFRHGGILPFVIRGISGL
ncbi:aconitate hydratase AcnA [Candidatus Uhrbacteria bacterium]|nr:aconitate hydratase AcnA [Candidatus Uhrbacteria bacterium]